MMKNPILRGFCPDPSIIKVKGDYYIATSTFEWWPGVRLFHSTDLEHWEQIASPLRRTSQMDLRGVPCGGGIWAPCLSYDGEWFYLVYTIVTTKKGPNYNTHNYVVRTKDIRGDWSDPVCLNSVGFDPSLFHDTDGRKYLINMVNGFKGIMVTEYDADKGKLVGSPHRVYRGTGRRCTEGPHMYHIGDYYYILTAEGGTGYTHCETVARSKNIYGPYEVMPGEVLITADEADDRVDKPELYKCGHADILKLDDGRWVLVFLCSRSVLSEDGKMYSTLGRETAIEEIIWDNDGWPRLKCGGILPRRYIETDISLTGKASASMNDTQVMPTASIGYDSFCSDRLPDIYVSPRISYEDKISLSARKGYLRMYGRESLDSLIDVSLIAVRQKEHEAVASVRLEFAPEYEEQAAGIVYIYDALNYYLLAVTGGRSVYDDTDDGYDDKGLPLQDEKNRPRRRLRLIHSDMGVITDLTEGLDIPDGTVELKIETGKDRRITFYYNSISLPVYGSMDKINDEYCRGFTGAQFGLHVQDMTGYGAYADFEPLLISYTDEG